ncbi:MAG: hypothetical protein HRF52_08405 [Ignavibacterium sp.]|jgi:hypothetical protein|uniref:hypothetical protein n=1 Tax=Ignavibacterium sp. TaxID=2651167 RepID=UPI00329905C4
MKRLKQTTQLSILLVSILFVFLSSTEVKAQFTNVWMSAGSLHSWYSEIGSELEEAFVRRQQYGMQWPAIYKAQDMQAARGFWIGAKNFTDENGNNFPYKVVTIGPRNPMFYAAYPVKMELVSKFDAPIVTVDGNLTYEKSVTIDRVEDTLKADRMIINVVNTQLGVTMERKIYQFSQQYHDNYVVYEYTFTNTGNTDGDPEIELPNNTINDMYVFWTYRNAVNASTRFVIGNSTGWGKNTMNDARGDGVKPDPAGEQFRCQFSWHGYTGEKDVSYDNIGGPIWSLNSNALLYNASDDTIGRLGATQFIGVVTLHADKSATDKSDDPAQPSHTSYLDSDDDKFLGGRDNAFNIARMTVQYQFMANTGHMSPRHADLVEPSGDFALQRTNPNLGNTGGFSFNNGYGPYTLGPGESVRIVMVEGANGLSRAEQIRVGRLFKNGGISALEKDRIVIDSGRVKLMETFQRATENFNSGWNIPQPPRPPQTFEVVGLGDRISLTWSVDPSDPNPPTGFKIYRALGDYYKDYTLIAELPADARNFDDVTAIRGFSYFYFITAVGADQPGGPGTPPGKLESSRYYTQTYEPVTLKRPPEKGLANVRIVPNPFIIDSDFKYYGRYDDDKISFFNLPTNCTIRIYTELGELIKTIEHKGSGDNYWYNVTSSNQIIASGIYIAVFTDNDTGESKIEKFAIIR